MCKRRDFSGKITVLHTCASEEGRQYILEKYVGTKLSPVERAAIRGTAIEIKGVPGSA